MEFGGRGQFSFLNRYQTHVLKSTRVGSILMLRGNVRFFPGLHPEFITVQHCNSRTNALIWALSPGIHLIFVICEWVREPIVKNLDKKERKRKPD